MKIVGIMPCRNEECFVGLSARAALMWCDELVVLNHASTDGTAAILADVVTETGRLTILEESDPTWREMAHRQRLLNAARERGATHCALIDADEVLTGNLLAGIRHESEKLQPRDIAMIPWLCMWRSPFHVRVDQFSRFYRAKKVVAFRDSPDLRYQTDNGYDHHHTHPYGSVLRYPTVAGGLMHLQFSEWPRVVAKHALYKMIETVRWPGRKPAAQINAYYDPSIAENGLRTEPAPAEWWTPYAGILKHLRLGLEPWQAAECRRLMAECGPDKFAGLGLYGVA